MKRLQASVAALAAAVIALMFAPVVMGQAEDLTFFVVVKSSNYTQARNGNLTLLNYHFFSEVFLKEGGEVTDARIWRKGHKDGAMTYKDRGHNHYMEGGHFATLAAVDAAFPNGVYVFDVSTPSGDIDEVALTLAGPAGESQIPAPITITLLQDGEEIDPLAIDPNKALLVDWSEFEIGEADPRGIIDDLIFFVIQNCHGVRIVHTGLPFEEAPYLTYEAGSYTVPTGTMKPGAPHSMFVEFPNQVNTVMVDGVAGFATYATASYLDTRTTGEPIGKKCPDTVPPMDTGQTDR